MPSYIQDEDNDIILLGEEVVETQVLSDDSGDSFVIQVGIQGPEGSQGVTGPTGPQGIPGPTGATGPTLSLIHIFKASLTRVHSMIATVITLKNVQLTARSTILTSLVEP